LLDDAKSSKNLTVHCLNQSSYFRKSPSPGFVRSFSFWVITQENRRAMHNSILCFFWPLLPPLALHFHQSLSGSRKPQVRGSVQTNTVKEQKVVFGSHRNQLLSKAFLHSPGEPFSSPFPPLHSALSASLFVTGETL